MRPLYHSDTMWTGGWRLAGAGKGRLLAAAADAVDVDVQIKLYHVHDTLTE